MKQVILCDFDGTISTRDVSNTLCAQYLGPRYLEIEDAWERGEISATECYEREYEALALHKEEIDATLASIDICPGTRGLLDVASRRGWEFHILSAGFDYFIETILGRYGIVLPYVANYMTFGPTGEPRLAFLDHDDPDCHRFKHPCSGCKPDHWRQWKARGYRTAYVGDGSTDFCMADAFAREREPGDLLFAKHRLRDYCREQAIDAIPIDTLADVALYLGTRD
jgi:2-hydroxy-3-keto-5-methylthiopentenyl-1-phosphate phosphatase